MWRLLAGLFAFPLVLVATGLLLPPEGTLTGWAVFNFVTSPLILGISIALHEAGHALVARMVGLDVPRLEIGVGRRILKWRWRSTRFSLNAFPLLGLTYVGAGRVEGLRWRLWLTILAGPATTALIAACGLVSLDVSTIDVLWPRHAVLDRPAIGELIAFYNIWLVILNLLPAQVLLLDPFRNDGTLLMRIPFADQREINELTVVSAALEAEDLRESDQIGAAYEIISRAMQVAPESRALRNSLAIVLMHSEQLHEARVLLSDLVNEGKPVETLVMRNNLAWVDFLIHSDDLRAEADENSALVFQRFSEMGFALGTRGAVLGWLGRHDEAVDMLQRAYARNSSEINRALNACSLAYSFAAKGKTDEAARWLMRARTNHPNCPLLARSETAVAAASQASVVIEVASNEKDGGAKADHLR